MGTRYKERTTPPKVKIVEGSISSSSVVPMRRHLPQPRVLAFGAAVFLLAGSAFFLFSTTWARPRATIVLHPVMVFRSDIVQVVAMATPHTEAQSLARVLANTQSSPHLSVQATGIVQKQATAARGMLTFYNPTGFAQTVVGGTTIGQTELQVMTDQSVTIAAGSPSAANSATVAAHVLQTGTQGNIAPLTIDGLCTGCSGTDLAVKNLAAFWGGQDAVRYTTVRAADVTSVTPVQEPLLETQSRNGLREHIRAGEQLGAPVACAQRTTSDPAVGARAEHVFVGVTVTCTALVYNPADVMQRAATLFRSGIERSLDHHMILVQPVTARIQRPVVEHVPDTLSIPVLVGGRWLYHMSAAEQASLIRRLAGIVRKQALAEVLGIPGIEGATIEGIGGDDQLPADPGQLTLRIV